MAEHTPEPWTICNYDGADGVVVAADGHPLFGGYFRTNKEREATRRRFVAAVNACKGIPTEMLECANQLDNRLRLEGLSDAAADQAEILAIEAQNTI